MRKVFGVAQATVDGVVKRRGTRGHGNQSSPWWRRKKPQGILVLAPGFAPPNGDEVKCHRSDRCRLIRLAIKLIFSCHLDLNRGDEPKFGSSSDPNFASALQTRTKKKFGTLCTTLIRTSRQRRHRGHRAQFPRHQSQSCTLYSTLAFTRRSTKRHCTIPEFTRVEHAPP